MKIKLEAQGGDDRDVMANLAIDLIYNGNNNMRVTQVKFKHNGKKYKFKSSYTYDMYEKMYPELNIGR